MFDSRKTTATFEFLVQCAGCQTIYPVFCGAGTSGRQTLVGCNTIDEIRVL